jgi:hypothetical protein
MLALQSPDTRCALLRRRLAARCYSLLRRSPAGASVIHMAGPTIDALKLLVGSGLPHLNEAVNAIAMLDRTHASPICVTPLHCACTGSSWDAALALLAAGARVDIAGDIDDRHQTMAEWARDSVVCKHRGVKSAIAARAREHTAQAAAATKGLPSGGTRSVAGEAAGAAASAAPGSGSAADFKTGTSTTSAAVRTAAEKGKQPKGRKGRCGAASNRAEEASADDADVAPRTAAAAAAATTLRLLAVDGSAGELASAAPAPAASAALSACLTLTLP